MGDGRPMFSIVMPTRNRASLLRYALQSALDQTFTDYEIVVSNNSSADDTEQVTREVGGDRVRYVRTDRVLPMHESWEFALSQARGEWIMFLCDDDALYPDALQIISRALESEQTELITWRSGQYFLNSPFVPQERRGQVVIFPGTGGQMKVDSASQLKWLFNSMFGSPVIPKMLNSCAHRALVARVKQRVGRFFVPPAPDYSCCAAMLALTNSFVVVDCMLGLGGAGAHISGVSSETGKPTNHVQFVNDFAGRMFHNTPLSHLTGTNAVGESLLAVQKELQPEMSGLSLNPVSYYVWNYDEMLGLEASGLDIAELRKEFHGALRKEPWRVRTAVRTSIMARWLRSFLQTGVIRRAIVGMGITRLLDATIRRRRQKVVGWGAGFPNILEAVRHASQSDDAYRKARESRRFAGASLT